MTGVFLTETDHQAGLGEGGCRWLGTDLRERILSEETARVNLPRLSTAPIWCLSQSPLPASLSALCCARVIKLAAVAVVSSLMPSLQVK